MAVKTDIEDYLQSLDRVQADLNQGGCGLCELADLTRSLSGLVARSASLTHDHEAAFSAILTLRKALTNLTQSD